MSLPLETRLGPFEKLPSRACVTPAADGGQCRLIFIEPRLAFRNDAGKLDDHLVLVEVFDQHRPIRKLTPKHNTPLAVRGLCQSLNSC